MPGLLDRKRLAALRKAPWPDEAHLLDDDRVIGRVRDYTVVYGPFPGTPEPGVEVMFVGLTPGYQQLALATEVARENPRLSSRLFAAELRHRAAFAGPMRSNLTQMLDDLSLHRHLAISSTTELFGAARERLGVTSALRYPVFRNASELPRQRRYRARAAVSGNAGHVASPDT